MSEEFSTDSTSEEHLWPQWQESQLQPPNSGWHRDALLKDYTTNSDILQELMELADVTDIDNQTADLEDDLEEIERLCQELHRLLTLQQTYMEVVAVKSQTIYLLTAKDVASHLRG